MRMSHFARLWMILALAVLVAVVYAPSTIVLGEQWTDFVNITYTHGWLILAVSIALAIRDRDALTGAHARVSPLALAALLVCSFVWLVCYRASIQDLHITILPAIFWLAATTAFGPVVGRALLFPVLFVYFAEPSWGQLSNPLQALTVAAMHVALAITGPHTWISGALVHIPNGTFEIQEGCSGLHFMIVGLAVAALHGELRRDPWRTRVAQLTLMTALALLGNWVRVYVIIQVGYLTDMHSSLLANHYWFGWGVFGVALVAFFWIRARLDPQPPADVTAASASAPAPDIHARTDVAGFVIAAVVLVALPGASAAVRLLRAPPPFTAIAAVPRAPWAPAPVDFHSSWQPVFEGADLEQRMAFARAGDDTVEVFTVTYRNQRQGAKLVGSDNTLFGGGLQLRSDTVVNSSAGAFRESEVEERVSPYGLQLMWWRYRAAGRDFVNPIASQLWYGLNATLGHPSAFLVAFRTACHPDCAAARLELRGFAESAAVQ
jgi:exosortase